MKGWIQKICACGCDEIFYPNPIKVSSNRVRYSDYKRGHHPNTSKNLKELPAWNKGMTKGDHPSLASMGFQEGHKAFNDWSKVNIRLITDADFKERRYSKQRGKTPWNKGLKLSDYPCGVITGSNHGNWRGGSRSIRDTAEYKRFCRQVLNRDNYTCKECGDHNYKGRGSRIRLEVHHLLAVADNHNLVLEPTNAITLCHSCHTKTENFGTKFVHKRKKQGDK